MTMQAFQIVEQHNENWIGSGNGGLGARRGSG
jgi:hypothetical protein